MLHLRRYNPMPVGWRYYPYADRSAVKPLNSGLMFLKVINMITKVVVLFDGGFYQARFRTLKGVHPKPDDVINEVDNVMQLVANKTNGDTKDILFRIYYYDCRPFGNTVKDHTRTKDIDFSASASFRAKSKFLDDLCKKDRVALRLGELSFNGWIQDYYNNKLWKPDFKQKGVDMKVGLDMAWMATKRIVDKVVLVAGDADFISPIKFVRKEGLQVYLYPMGQNVKESLINHCDFVI